MANEQNLKPVRTKEEARERGRNGGKASGKARRRKADFRKTLNMLLTVDIEHPEITPILDAMGIDSTPESAMLMAQIKEAMDGNTKAAYFVAQYAGQNDRLKEDIENKKADTELKKARKEAVSGDRETDEALDRLDKILEGLRDNAADR